MLKAYHRLHEAWKRLIILGHIIWYAIYVNRLIGSYGIELEDVLINILGPPVFTVIFLNIFFFFYDKRKGGSS